MPFGGGTGPLGTGPIGWGLGPCGRGRGLGRVGRRRRFFGYGMGYGWRGAVGYGIAYGGRYPAFLDNKALEDEINILKARIEELENIRASNKEDKNEEKK